MKRRSLSLALAGAAALALVLGVVSTSPASTAHADDKKVPIIGTFTYTGSANNKLGSVVGALHSVVRIPGGTAVFYSVGGEGATPLSLMGSSDFSLPYTGRDAWEVKIADPTGLKLYLPLFTSKKTCLCSSTDALTQTFGTKTPHVGYAVLPPLPAKTKSVTVEIGYGAQLTDVPVTDTLPGPTSSKKQIETGDGWPKLPAKDDIKAADPSRSIMSLVRNVTQGASTTSMQADSQTISLNSDVLFETNSADLSPDSKAEIEHAAKTINTAGKGEIQIVGYTDSTGDDALNQKLSEARAQTVLDALKPLITKQGVNLTAAGKGAADPVADNGTDAGRKLNRRVTITFSI